MTIHLVTFSDESMSRSAQLCVESAQRHGADSVAIWDRDAIHFTGLADGDNFQVLDLMNRGERGGGGWWCWKPYIIHDTMCQSCTGDLIIYSDAGIEFINNVSHIIERMDQDIFLFGNNWEHAHWCKRDVVEEIWPISCKEWDDYRKPLGLDWDADEEFDKLTWSRFGKQVQASVIFLRVSDYTRDIVQEWLDWCLFEGGRLIDDSPSRALNHPEFREHRHDQAILTTLAYREGIKLHYWPAMYNDGAFSYEKLPEYAGDDYPILFHHHRRRNHEWKRRA